MTGNSETLALLCRNAIDVIDKEELGSRLSQSAKEAKPLRIKAGFDPSAPDIHLGHAVLLRKLRQFQDVGHKVILLIGDFTAMIGDPTGKTTTRPALSKDEVEKNAQTYQAQAFKILDKDPKKIEIVHNSAWLGKMSLADFVGKIASQTTVARILERDDFEKRMKENQPLSMREMMYPLFQGYDSVEVRADIEIGGSDQKFNLLMGRQLQKSFGQRPQIVMTYPLLVGLDGAQKMSKSLGNYIALTDSPKDVFGKAMSIPDKLMPQYFNLLTDLDGDNMARKVASNELHPRAAKLELAKILTGSLHGIKAAENEAAEFDRVFSNKESPENPDDLVLAPGEIWIVDLLKKAGAADSSSDARRLIEQGGVTVGGVKMTDPKATITVTNGLLIKAGKKKFVRLSITLN